MGLTVELNLECNINTRQHNTGHWMASLDARRAVTFVGPSVQAKVPCKITGRIVSSENVPFIIM